MKKRLIAYIFLILFSLSMAFAESNNENVYLIPIKGEINYATDKFVENKVQEAEKNGASMIIFEIDTFGGAVNSAINISNTILNTTVPTVSYIKDNAISAGVLISISSDKVVANSTINIGSAETRPKEEKYISFWTGKLRTVAKKKGRNEEIIAGMADADVEIEGIKEKGKLLNLTADEALKHGIVDEIVDSKKELYNYLNINNSDVTEVNYDFRTNVARFTNNITVSSILIAIGIIGIVGEIFVAGFGLLGSLGILSFALFFAGRMFAGHAGYGILTLFAAGIILLIIEAVVPGFGFPGISGISCVVVSIILSSSDPMTGAASLLIGIALSIVAIYLLLKFAPKSKYFDHIILRKTQDKKQGYESNTNQLELVGKTGVVATFMRPSGTVIVEDKRYDAITEGEFIEKGSKIEIIKVEGNRITVRKKNESKKGE